MPDEHALPPPHHAAAFEVLARCPELEHHRVGDRLERWQVDHLDLKTLVKTGTLEPLKPLLEPAKHDN